MLGWRSGSFKSSRVLSRVGGRAIEWKATLRIRLCWELRAIHGGRIVIVDYRIVCWRFGVVGKSVMRQYRLTRGILLGKVPGVGPFVKVFFSVGIGTRATRQPFE